MTIRSRKFLVYIYTYNYLMSQTHLKYNIQMFCLYSGPVKTVLYEGLQEKDVGITEYTTSVPGVSGILKHRWIKDKQYVYVFFKFIINITMHFLDCLIFKWMKLRWMGLLCVLQAALFQKRKLRILLWKVINKNNLKYFYF